MKCLLTQRWWGIIFDIVSFRTWLSSEVSEWSENYDLLHGTKSRIKTDADLAIFLRCNATTIAENKQHLNTCNFISSVFRTTRCCQARRVLSIHDASSLYLEARGGEKNPDRGNLGAR